MRLRIVLPLHFIDLTPENESSYNIVNKGGQMVRKCYTPEQIINRLREAEVKLSQGATIAVITKKIGVSDHTYYHWRKEYGGMKVDQVHRLKELEQENSRLKKLVADLSLDNAILKERPPGETLKPVLQTQDGAAGPAGN